MFLSAVRRGKGSDHQGVGTRQVARRTGSSARPRTYNVIDGAGSLGPWVRLDVDGFDRVLKPRAQR